MGEGKCLGGGRGCELVVCVVCCGEDLIVDFRRQGSGLDQAPLFRERTVTAARPAAAVGGKHGQWGSS